MKYDRKYVTDLLDTHGVKITLTYRGISRPTLKGGVPDEVYTHWSGQIEATDEAYSTLIQSMKEDGSLGPEEVSEFESALNMIRKYGDDCDINIKPGDIESLIPVTSLLQEIIDAPITDADEQANSK